MLNKYGVLAICLFLSACGSSGSNTGVVDKVLTDFGIRQPGDDYEQPSDRIFSRLDAVGKSEMSRMNGAARYGEIKFQDDGGLGGMYYKEVKLYETYRPLDAQRMSRTSARERGYFGFIDFSYRVFQSERRSNRTEASALSANIPTDTTGHETYRFTFGPGGTWTGQKGELTRR